MNGFFLLQCVFAAAAITGVSEAFSSATTRPIAPWIGRMVFAPENHKPGEDAVSIVLEQAPGNLVGKTATLTWTPSKGELKSSFLDRVTQDVRFSDSAHESMEKGNVHPTRLDGLHQVGPLESLAGARAENDVHVILPDPVMVTKDGEDKVMLEIANEPVQVTGTSYMAAAIRRHVSDNQWEVQHFNVQSGSFDGEKETIAIPASVTCASGKLATVQYLEDHIGSEWYFYGSANEKGVFEVEALESYHAVSLEKPGEIIVDEKTAISFIDGENWKQTPTKGGTWHTALLDLSATSPEMALGEWKEDDRCLLLHLFGGIEGVASDRVPVLGAVGGHFAYGLATVVRDAVTKDLCFDIDYTQIYGHNVNGIISGHVKRSSYGGDLLRGWLGVRPISDIVVKFDLVTRDYTFGFFTLSPMNEFVRELDIMMARYRVGDGTGAAIVTPSRSCVQDSSQALYVALNHVEDMRKAQPDIDAWLENHPDDPETIRYRKLQDFGRALEKDLVPLGIVRRDWKQNERDMVGAVQSSNPSKVFLRALFSWQTCFPRRAQDEMAKLLLKYGGKLWFIRTNQIGVTVPGAAPLAPTALFGANPADNVAE